MSTTPKYSQYRVVYSGIHNRMDELILSVNRAMDEGWEPLGGLVAANGSMYQALAKVRREK